MLTFQLWTSRKHRIAMMQLIFQFRKMSEKTLYRDESVFTWLIYTNLLFPWEKKKKKQPGVAKFVAQVHMYKLIHIHVFKLYFFFPDRSAEWYVSAFLSIRVHLFRACFKRLTEFLKVNDKGVWVVEH